MISPQKTSGLYVPNLRDYAINFINETYKMRFSDVVPESLCPFLLHTCLSYIYTFTLGGRFPWMEMKENKNSVFVQCPNPADGVVALVYKENDQIFVRITMLKGRCCFGHKINDTIKLTPGEDIKIQLTVIDSCFAWLTYLDRNDSGDCLLSPEMVVRGEERCITFYLEKIVHGGTPARFYQRPCSKLEMNKDLKLKLSSFRHRCGYFKWPKREYYNNENFGPKGLCIDLFHLSHMYAMGSIYAYKKESKPVIVYCNDKEACVKLSIKVKKTKTYLLRRIFILLLRFFRINKIIPELICEMVVEEGAEQCPMKLTKGMKFTYNMGRRYELCPASFDNLYFIIHNLLRGGDVPWDKTDNDSEVAVCPDDVSNIAFKFD